MKKLLLILVLATIGLSANAQFTTLLNFGVALNGSYPIGDLFYDGTYLYGMTQQGGTNNLGTIFKIMPDGNGYVKLMDFAGVANGSKPNGSLISDGTFLYGTSSEGGTNNKGTVFKIMPDGSGYTNLFNFDTLNGQTPMGSLVFDGTWLYGMTQFGGVYYKGVVFKIMPDGSGFAKLLELDGPNFGGGSQGSLMYDGTYLYGMAQNGGSNSKGTIFRIKPDASGFSILLNFAGASTGKWPNGYLISDGTFLYGLAKQGGTNDFGTLFKIMPNGSGFVKLMDFTGPNGKFPYGSLYYDGTFLYGMTMGGGINSYGTIFKIMPDGSGYHKLYNFVYTDGAGPLGTLISDGAYLYGMAQGGTTDYGTVFKLSLSDTAFMCNMFVSTDSIVNETSTGSNDGSIHISINDGTPPYQFAWSNGDTTQNVSGLSSAAYTVTVTDSSNCQTLASFSVINSSDTTFLDCTDSLTTNIVDTCFNFILDSASIYNFSFSSNDTLLATWIVYSEDSTHQYFITVSYTPDSSGCYTAVLTVTCAKKKVTYRFTDNIYYEHINTSVTTLERPNDNVSIFPNPTSENLTIISNETRSLISIFNIEGQLLLQRYIGQGKSVIDISRLAKGIYFVKIKTDKGIVVKKFIKE